MRVCDLMQREVVILDASESLGLADDIMRLGRIRHMPVLSQSKLVGILSQRDLFRAAMSSALHPRPAVERKWLASIRVSEVMTAPVFTVTPDASIHSAVEEMLVRRIGCLPVVDNDTLVGLLSETDCLRYLARLLDVSEVSERLPPLLDQ